MGEFNAILGINGLKMVDKKVKRRNKIAELYTDFFKNYKGITFQKIENGNTCNFKDYSIIADPEILGIDRDALAIALKEENIDTRKYFYPPVHMQEAFSSYNGADLEVTKKISFKVLSLPIYSSLTDTKIEKICYAFARIIKYKDEIKRKVKLWKKT
jgi:dTDP-4-amino-4,6-dideoxygalactose transaminase